MQNTSYYSTVGCSTVVVVVVVLGEKLLIFA
jgi:hypothetical protein